MKNNENQKNKHEEYLENWEHGNIHNAQRDCECLDFNFDIPQQWLRCKANLKYKLCVENQNCLFRQLQQANEKIKELERTFEFKEKNIYQYQARSLKSQIRQLDKERKCLIKAWGEELRKNKLLKVDADSEVAFVDFNNFTESQLSTIIENAIIAINKKKAERQGETVDVGFWDGKGEYIEDRQKLTPEEIIEIGKNAEV